MNIRTFMLLYWSNNHCIHSNIHSLPLKITMTREHCNCFLHHKSTSCTHISHPTHQIHLLYSHFTSYTPHLTHVLIYHFLQFKSISCSHISLSLLKLYLLHSHASTLILKWQFILGYSRLTFPWESFSQKFCHLSVYPSNLHSRSKVAFYRSLL
jgi:hypothetical protein